MNEETMNNESMNNESMNNESMNNETIAKLDNNLLNKNRFSCFRKLFVNVLPFFTAAKTSAGTTHTARIRRAAYDTYGAQRREIL